MYDSYLILMFFHFYYGNCSKIKSTFKAGAKFRRKHKEDLPSWTLSYVNHNGLFNGSYCSVSGCGDSSKPCNNWKLKLTIVTGRWYFEQSFSKRCKRIPHLQLTKLVRCGWILLIVKICFSYVDMLLYK